MGRVGMEIPPWPLVGVVLYVSDPTVVARHLFVLDWQSVYSVLFFGEAQCAVS